MYLKLKTGQRKSKCTSLGNLCATGFLIQADRQDKNRRLFDPEPNISSSGGRGEKEPTPGSTGGVSKIPKAQAAPRTTKVGCLL